MTDTRSYRPLCLPMPSQSGLILWAIVLAAGLALALLPLQWLVIAVPGTAFLLLTLVKPHLALYLLCFAVPFGSLFEVDLGGITVGVTEGLVGIMIAAWIARSIALREGRWTWPRLSAPLALFVGAALISAINASGLTLFLKEIAKWLEFLGVMLFASSAIDRDQSRTVVASALLAGAAQALLGAYQFFTQSGPESFVMMGRYMRAYGTFEQPNPYGGYLGLVAPVAFALAVSLLKRRGAPAAARSAVERRAQQPVPLWLQGLAAASFALIGVAIGMSGSRGAWLAFGAGFGFMNVVRSRRGATTFITVVAVLALFGLLGSFRLLPEPAGRLVQTFGGRLTSFASSFSSRDVRGIEITDANYASVERLAFWQAALDMWRDHPWLGIGFGNYQAAYVTYSLPKWPMSLGHAHNYYLNVAAEAGLIGLTTYLWLWGMAIWQMGRAFREAGDPYVRALALGALGMLVHISVHNVVDNLWVHSMYIHVAIILGLVYGRRGPAHSLTHNRSRFA
ncbi:MAG: O-antigen ligase family protein [Anaerolineae bacterium]|nr:O-antigen ligase family protein [Anaerolineae bacterium]